MRTALPRSNAPESSLVTLFIEAVQDGHRSTSTSTDQTASGVASMSIAVRNRGRPSAMAAKVRSDAMTVVDTAILLLRVTVGLTMVAHGYNHLRSLAGTARWFGSLGMRPPKLHAMLSGVGETAAGAALAIGLLTPLAAAFVVGTMVVAGVAAHRGNGFFVFKDGYEYVLMIAVVCAVIGLLGPGAASVDALFGLDTALDGAVGLLLAAGLGVVGAAALLAATWRPVRGPAS